MGQRMLWMVDHYRGGEGSLNYPLVLRLRGDVDEGDVADAFEQLIARHEALRTTYLRRRGVLTQLIHPPDQASTPIVVERMAAAGLDDALAAERRARIDPTEWPSRLRVWRLIDAPDEVVACFNVHHLGTDAWSCRVLTDELVQLLAGSPLSRPGWQYRHFVQSQRRATSAQRASADETYWRARLAQLELPALPITEDVSDAALNESRIVDVDLDVELSAKVRDLAASRATTPFVVMLAAFYWLLRDKCAQDDLAVASPFSNRLRPEVMATVGFFANLVVLRTSLAGIASFDDAITRTATAVADAAAHQAYPYYLLPTDVANGGPTRRVDDVVFQMLPELPPPIRAKNVDVEVLRPRLASRFPLEVTVTTGTAAGFGISVQHSPHRLTADIADRLAHGFRGAITAAIAPLS